MSSFKIFHGDCLEVLQRAPSDSMDSIVCDPPYGLSFMGKKWDYDVPTVEIWKECLRVLKPGGHLLAFGGTRTYHRLVVAIEDAGFEIRDQIQWIYGQGFPKSQNLAKASGDESLAGLGTALKPANEPICLARKPLSESTIAKNVLKHGTGGMNIDAGRVATTDKLQKLNGSFSFNSGEGADVKGKKIEFVDAGLGRFPSNVILDEDAAAVLDGQSGVSSSNARKNKGNKKPLSRDSQVMATLDGTSFSICDTGGASRFFYVAKASKSDRNSGLKGYLGWESLDQGLVAQTVNSSAQLKAMFGSMTPPQDDSEWNTFLFGNSTTDLSQLGLTSITSTASKTTITSEILSALANLTTSESIQDVIKTIEANGSSLAESVEAINRLKPSITDEVTEYPLGAVRAVLQALLPVRKLAKEGNFHSTVKPIKLMEYLIKLVTPEGGTVLDPFMGSGTTGVAALRNGFQFRGIEREESYYYISQARLEKESAE